MSNVLIDQINNHAPSWATQAVVSQEGAVLDYYSNWIDAMDAQNSNAGSIIIDC